MQLLRMFGLNLDLFTKSTLLELLSKISNSKITLKFQHGRLKVRTSAEEAARKKKEQDQKVKLYRVGMKQIFVKRAAQQFDDEMMSLTAAILGKNPDISTLWNIRRDCILLQDSDHIVDADKLKQTFQKDLDFTEHCLLVNPKSYCVWHHRCWILEHSPNPNWTNEVDVCTKYLKLDERNCKEEHLKIERHCHVLN